METSMTTKTATTLTVADIEAGYEHDGWLGFGYLGERRFAIAAVRSGEREFVNVTAADELVLRIANEQGWTPEQLFDWANSKLGRWYGDVTLGCEDLGSMAARYVKLV
jgi:hypothetical protein